MSSLSTTSEPSRWAQIWNSNIAYSFRRNPVAVASLLVFAVITVNFLVDLAYALVDPRLRSRT